MVTINRNVFGTKRVGVITIDDTYATGGIKVGGTGGVAIIDGGYTGTLTGGKLVIKTGTTEVANGTAVAGSGLIIFN